MISRALVSCVLLVGILAVLPARAQDDNLYIPPALTISASDTAARPVVRIDISGYLDEQMLLPAIFFDHPGEYEIAARYAQLRNGEARHYSDTAAVWGRKRDYEKYYQLLNIIGDRMRRDTTVHLGLRGGYSTEAGEDAGVATTRAEVIREYLTTVWSIAPERLVLLEPRRLCDSADHLMRQEEARCVLFEPSDWRLLRPVRFRRIESNINQLHMRIDLIPNVRSELVESIHSIMTAGDREVGRDTLPGRPGTIRYALAAAWQITPSPQFLDDGPLSLTAVIHTRDSRLLRSNAETIRLVVDRGALDRPHPRAFLRHLLPGFDHRDTTLNAYQRMVIDDVIGWGDTGAPIVVAARGGSDASESSAPDPIELSAAHRDAIVAAEIAERLSRESALAQASGQLIVMEMTNDLLRISFGGVGREPHGKLAADTIYATLPNVKWIFGDVTSALGDSRGWAVIADIHARPGIDLLSRGWGEGWEVGWSDDPDYSLRPEQRCFDRSARFHIYHGIEAKQMEHRYREVRGDFEPTSEE